MNLPCRFALLLAFLLPAPAAAQEAAPARAPWSERVLDLAASLPIQDGGRRSNAVRTSAAPRAGRR